MGHSMDARPHGQRRHVANNNKTLSRCRTGAKTDSVSAIGYETITKKYIIMRAQAREPASIKANRLVDVS
jgi:hypothetical protein